MSEPRTDQAYVVSHEAEYLTPADAVASRARADVYNVEKVLQASGVPPEQIHAAADLNAKNARLEFEARQDEDPIRRVIGILEKSVVSGRDKEIIDKQIIHLEEQRTSWKNAIETERRKRQMQEKESLPFEDTARDVIRSNQAPTPEVSEGAEIEILSGHFLTSQETPTQEFVKPTASCVTKVLTGIGVLHPDETVNDLVNVIRASGNSKPDQPRFSAWNHDEILNLPTSLPGINAKLNIGDNRVSISVGIKTLEKIVAFPASV